MKPILFSTAMVVAILENRKNMTRRVIKPQPRLCGETIDSGDCLIPNCCGYDEEHFCNGTLAKPRYQIGEVLYVRETWLRLGKTYCYRADGEINEKPHLDSKLDKWKPSIHMPKEAARIFLRVTDVRVERVQSILCGDMKAEGCIPPTVKGGQWQQWQRDYFAPLWNSINGKRNDGIYAWEKNPWVWVYTFERCEKSEGE